MKKKTILLVSSVLLVAALVIAVCLVTSPGYKADVQISSLLKKNITDSSDWQRFAAICALLSLNTVESLKVIEENRDDEDQDLRRLREEIIAGKGVGSLKCTLESENGSWRSYTPRILIFLNTTEFIPDLERLATNKASTETGQNIRLAIRYLKRMKERR